MSQLAEHLAVVGPSGGGKTTHLRERHAREDGPSVFLTTKTYERTAAHSPPFRVRRSNADYPADIRRVRSWARQRNETVQVVVDEVDNAPTFTEGEGPLLDGLEEDREDGVKYVIATQNPQNLHHPENGYGPIQNCEYLIWVGPVKTWHEGFLRSNGLYSIIDRFPSSNYEYVVVDPTSSIPAEEKIVYRGETDPRFG